MAVIVKSKALQGAVRELIVLDLKGRKNKTSDVKPGAVSVVDLEADDKCIRDPVCRLQHRISCLKFLREDATH